MGVRIFLVKVVAASAAVLSSAVTLRLATPAATRFLTAEAPRLFESVSGWLTPPYLYFVINGIIISIAATSHFQKPITASDDMAFYPKSSATPPTISAYANPVTTEFISKFAEDDNIRPAFLAPEIGADEVIGLPVSTVEANLEEGFAILNSSWSTRRVSSQDLPEKSDAAGVTKEKSPVSTRVVLRRSIKSSQEAGKALGVARSKKQETLESTWKTITDGRHVPLGRRLKKSDTWDTRMRTTTADPAPPPPAMLKSETFAARSIAAVVLPSPSSQSASASPSDSKDRRESSSGKLRRESSVGQDDLNRRVEAFIKKFNEEMRLQRQKSLQQYMDMINSPGH